MGAINYIWDEENDSLLEEVDDDGNVIVSYTNEPGPFGKVISQVSIATKNQPFSQGGWGGCDSLIAICLRFD